LLEEGFGEAQEPLRKKINGSILMQNYSLSKEHKCVKISSKPSLVRKSRHNAESSRQTNLSRLADGPARNLKQGWALVTPSAFTRRVH